MEERSRNHPKGWLPSLVLALAAITCTSPLMAQDAEAQFRKSCISCHTIGSGAKTGPDLKGVTSRRTKDWATAFIQGPGAAIDRGDPIALQLLKDANNVKMPELGITPQEAAALVQLIEEYTKSGKTLGTKGIDRPVTAQDIAYGKQFFEGRLRFKQGGPSCLSCHSAGNAGFAGGGGLGPHLNAAPGRYGKGLAAVIENPAFPTMQGPFGKRPLTAEEAFQVTAYLNSVSSQPPAKKDVLFPVLGFLGLVGSLEVGRRLGRKRFTGVRKNLTPKA